MRNVTVISGFVFEVVVLNLIPFLSIRELRKNLEAGF